MSNQIISKLHERINNRQKTAMVMLTENTGSSPGVDGELMLVFPDGNIVGTIGGGSLEYNVINRTLENMESGENFSFTYNLSETGDIGMICGGVTSGYVKYFIPGNPLIIFGAGHVGKALVEVASGLDFNITMVDSREEYLYVPEYEEVNKVLCPFDDLSEEIDYKDSYIVIMTPSHAYDYEVLRALVEKDYKYLGMMGSRKKVKLIMDRLRDDGVSDENVNRLNMPIGINIGTGTPKEIAISIICELLAVRSGTDEICFMSNEFKDL